MRIGFNRFMFSILLVLAVSNIHAQIKKADGLLYSENFESALDLYLEILEQEPENMAVNYKAGVCFLNTNIDKTKAIPYLEKFVTQPKYDNNADYLLGRAYHYAGKYDQAEKKFFEYLSKGGGTAASGAETQKNIEYCQNAKELMKYPLHVTYENLGKEVNSLYPDYFPFVPIDESFVIFNSARDDGSAILEDGTYTSNIYISKVVEGKFTDAKPLDGVINSNEFNEEIVGLSADGTIMLIYKETADYNGDLYITSRTGGTFEEPVKLEETINSKFHEISATISQDGNTIVFASDRKDGFGGTDLYMSKKLPIGGWGPPQNLGETINTADDEDFPNLSSDGRTLLFSSKGHVSMGGYDIFKAQWNPSEKIYENVRNIGYPVNSPFDDMNFRMSENGRYGYMASLRPEGVGEMDIYRITFNEVEPNYTAIRGQIKTDNPNNPADDAFLTITDNKTGDIVGDYLPNSRNMRYIMILPSGNYNLYIEAAGFQPYSEDIEILDKSSFKGEIEKDIELKSE